MRPYITPGRVKTLGLGIHEGEISDTDLVAYCAAATSIIDSHCLVPRLPQKHDFRGGTITSEQHAWRFPLGPLDTGQRQAYPMHWPITGISRLWVKATNTQYVNVAPTSLLVNNTARYVEIVSLGITSSGLWNALAIPIVGLVTPVVEMDYTYGWTFEEDELLSNTDGQTWRAQNQWWLDDVDHAPVITVDDVVADPGDYTVDADEGTVVFDTDLSATARVEAHYWHTLPTEIAYAAGQIVAYLHSDAQLRSRGMDGLTRLVLAGEITMIRPHTYGSNALPADLNTIVPAAAQLLASYRFDHVTVRA